MFTPTYQITVKKYFRTFWQNNLFAEVLFLALFWPYEWIQCGKQIQQFRNAKKKNRNFSSLPSHLPPHHPLSPWGPVSVFFFKVLCGFWFFSAIPNSNPTQKLINHCNMYRTLASKQNFTFHQFFLFPGHSLLRATTILWGSQCRWI